MGSITEGAENAAPAARRSLQTNRVAWKESGSEASAHSVGGQSAVWTLMDTQSQDSGLCERQGLPAVLLF